MTAPKPDLAAFLRPELPAAALYGLPGKVATSIANATGTDPAVVLLAYLTMLGNAVGSQPHVVFGGANQACRLFTLIVGDAAAGRKGTAVAAVESLLRDADPDWSATRGMHGLKSTVAMIAKVADGNDPRLLITETETGRLFSVMHRAGDLAAQLRNAWDGRALTNDVAARRGGTLLRASDPHVSLLGMITAGELLPLHRRDSGGLESRFLYCVSAPERAVSPFAAESEATRCLAAETRETITAARLAVLRCADPVSADLCARRGIQPDAEMRPADEVAAGWLSKIRPRFPAVDESLGAFFSRAETHVVRLAHGYALADMSPEIRMDHIEAALGLWTYCARSAERVFAVPVGELLRETSPKVTAKIVRHLHGRYPDWVPRDEIRTGLLGGNVSSAAIDLSMTDLGRQGLIETRTVSTEGRPRTEYLLRWDSA
jgi:hypothetical protein